MLCIGLAVGANAAVFALADALFLRPLDVPDADGLVTLASRPSDDDGRLSYQEFVDVRNEGRSFADLTALRPIRAGLAPSAQCSRSFVSDSPCPLGSSRPFWDKILVSALTIV